MCLLLATPVTKNNPLFLTQLGRRPHAGGTDVDAHPLCMRMSQCMPFTFCQTVSDISRDPSGSRLAGQSTERLPGAQVFNTSVVCCAVKHRVIFFCLCVLVVVRDKEEKRGSTWCNFQARAPRLKCNALKHVRSDMKNKWPHG